MGSGLHLLAKCPCKIVRNVLQTCILIFFALISFSDSSDVWCFIRVSSPWVWSLSWNIPSHHARQACQDHPTVTMVTLSGRGKNLYELLQEAWSLTSGTLCKSQTIVSGFQSEQKWTESCSSNELRKMPDFLATKETCIFAGSLLRHLQNEHNFNPHDVWWASVNY